MQTAACLASARPVGNPGDSVTDDWGLLEEARSDARRYGELFERHRDFVFRLAWGFVGERHADDVTQEVFSRILQRRKPWLRRARFTTVLYQITLNVAREIRRNARRDVELVGEDRLVASERSDRSATEKALRADLQRALALLSRRQRETVVLRYLEEISTRETARILGCSEGAVKTHLHRGLAALEVAMRDVRPSCDQPGARRAGSQMEPHDLVLENSPEDPARR